MKKSSLIDEFKTDEKKETEGQWLKVHNGIQFLVARFGGHNRVRRQEAVSKYYLPHTEKMLANDFSVYDRKRIDIQSFVYSCILDWDGVTLDGEIAPFNPEDLIDMLMELEELAETLIAFASSRDNYKHDLGNS